MSASYITRRWRVQAFLLRTYTGTNHDIPYRPTYFRWGWRARRFARKLAGDFGPGMARVEIVREPTQ